MPAQIEASGLYIAAETATAAVLKKNPQVLPTLKLLTADWAKYQGGTLTADEATLLQTIVTATKQQLTPKEAALLRRHSTDFGESEHHGSDRSWRRGCIIITVMNGISREIVVYTTPSRRLDGLGRLHDRFRAGADPYELGATIALCGGIEGAGPASLPPLTAPMGWKMLFDSPAIGGFVTGGSYGKARAAAMPW